MPVGFISEYGNIGSALGVFWFHQIIRHKDIFFGGGDLQPTPCIVVNNITERSYAKNYV